MAKAAYVLTNMRNEIHCVDDIEQEYPTEQKALKAATEKLNSGCDDEVWVWRLSHIVSRPDTAPDIEEVPPPRKRR